MSLFLGFIMVKMTDCEWSDHLPDHSNEEMCAVLWVSAKVSCEIKGQGRGGGLRSLKQWFSTFLML